MVQVGSRSIGVGKGSGDGGDLHVSCFPLFNLHVSFFPVIKGLLR